MADSNRITAASGAEKATTDDLVTVDEADHDHVAEVNNELTRTDSYLDSRHINLTWRSWIVVFISCFAIMAQVFVVVAAGSVIAFIVRDIGNPGLAGWIIQAPLLMQSVLSPIVGRLSDVLDRKWLASLPPVVAFVGAVISAKATDINMLIGGGILIGVTLPTIAIVQAIPAEVLPLKYRPLANGFAFLGGAIGGLIGGLGAGGVTNQNAHGWRNIFWMQAAFHLATTAGLFLFYHPQRRSDYPKMKIREYIWSIDPIGSTIFATSATLMLLGLDWAAGAYPWSDPHVAVNVAVGLFLMIVFCLYEWKGRSDGLVAHVFFKNGPNFALSVFAFGVEGWLFYSAVNSITPQIVLHLGFEDNSWDISVRQMGYTVPTITSSALITLYSTKTKDLKSPLLLTFGLFLIVVILYTTIRPTHKWDIAQNAINVLSGIGQAGPLTMLVALVQFTAPHAFLSTATGLAFSARAIGGAFGSAVIDAIINGKLDSTLAPQVSEAAIGAGLPSSSVAALLEAMAAGDPEVIQAVPGMNPQILAAATHASRMAYAHAYNVGWASVVPFVVLAIVAIWFLRGVKEQMTEHVEATVEKVPVVEEKGTQPV